MKKRIKRLFFSDLSVECGQDAVEVELEVFPRRGHEHLFLLGLQGDVMAMLVGIVGLAVAAGLTGGWV